VEHGAHYPILPQVFAWYEATRRPPDGEALELFARVAGRCSDEQKETQAYKVRGCDWCLRWWQLRGRGLEASERRRVWVGSNAPVLT
jgi:hypothetical protein